MSVRLEAVDGNGLIPLAAVPQAYPAAVHHRRFMQRVLRTHLSALWSHPSLWDDDEFINWIAYGATCSIEHLIDVGARPGDFADHVRQLAKHACAGNRDSCRNFLSKHYSWLE